MCQLYPYLTDDGQKKWLEKLLARDNRSAFKQYMEEGLVGFADLVTNELSSLKMGLVDLLHIVPMIQPRFYTISSSSHMFPTNVHLTIGITDMPTANGRKQFVGLCSQFVRRLSVGSTMRIFVRESSFRLPPSPSTPVLMIGPGTGLAPMRALLQERSF